MIIDIETAKELFLTKEEKEAKEQATIKEMKNSIKKAHWKNAREATSETMLKNLLANHEKHYCDSSKNDDCSFTKKERLDIIFFIKKRIRDEF